MVIILAGNMHGINELDSNSIKHNYLNSILESEGTAMGILVGCDTENSGSCGVYTKEAGNLGTNQQCAPYAWNEGTQKWEVVTGAEKISRLAAAAQFFGLTATEFGETATPLLLITMKKEETHVISIQMIEERHPAVSNNFSSETRRMTEWEIA